MECVSQCVKEADSSAGVILMEAGVENMPEGLAGDMIRSAQAAFMYMDVPVPTGLLRERPPAFELITGQNVEGSL